MTIFKIENEHVTVTQRELYVYGRSWIIIWVIFLLSLLNFALSNDHRSENKIARAVYTNPPPKIDGYVDRVWLKAPPNTRFIQRQPNQGEPATTETRFFVMYDKHNLYLLFIIQDPHGKNVPARLVERDNRFSPDDNINFYLDTYNDHRRAYFFSTNPLGVEQDGLISENGARVDMSWDCTYRVAARRNKYGWVAEFAIPFKVLRFDDSKDEQVWGINVWLIRKENREISYWSPVDQNYSMFRLDKGGILVGLKGIKGGKHLDLLPYFTTRQFASSGNWGDTELNGGLDMQYGLTSNLTLNLTANPDFGQVEIDEEQINLDKRFELILQEKRPFFLENATLFQLPIQTFYSRRIGAQSDIKGGVKLTGKLGAYNLGFISVATGDWKESGLGDMNNDTPEEFFNILRVQRDVMENSNVGLMFSDVETNPYGRQSSFNRSISVDWNLYLGQFEYFSGQIVRSDVSEGRQGNAARATFSHYDRLFYFYLDGFYYDKNFEVNGTGFFPKLPDNGRRQASLFLEAHPFINRKLVRRWGVNSLQTVFQDSRETEPAFGIQPSIWFETPDQTRLTFLTSQYREVEVDILGRFPQKVYRGSDYKVELRTDTGKPLSLHLSADAGTQYYFQTHMVGFSRGLSAELLFKPISNGFAEAGYEMRQFLDNDMKFIPTHLIGQNDVRVYYLRGRYLFNKNVFSRYFVQFTNGAEEVGFVVDGNGFRLDYQVYDRLSANVLFGWRFKPGSTLYLGYTEEWNNFQTNRLESANRILFFKFSYLFQF